MDNQITDTIQTDAVYNPVTDDKRPLWVNVLIFIGTALLAYLLWRAS